jgi:hypothetical protein
MVRVRQLLPVPPHTSHNACTHLPSPCTPPSIHRAPNHDCTRLPSPHCVPTSNPSRSRASHHKHADSSCRHFRHDTFAHTHSPDGGLWGALGKLQPEGVTLDCTALFGCGADMLTHGETSNPRVAKLMAELKTLAAFHAASPATSAGVSSCLSSALCCWCAWLIDLGTSLKLSLSPSLSPSRSLAQSQSVSCATGRPR